MNIEINKSKTYRSFEGFGASGAWWAQEVGGWEHIDPESGKSVRDRISELLYSKQNGIGLRTYRYNIGTGSADSDKGNYSQPLRRTECFEMSPGKYDFSRDRNAVYMMRKAAEDGADEIIMFVNSPLERLTKSGMAHGNPKFPGADNLPKKNYKAFAKYCLDVTEHFVKEGLPIKYLSPINEPVWIWTGGQEGCHYSPKNAGRVLKVFADEMDSRPALDGVKLSGLENGDIRWFNKSYTRNLFKYDSVRKRVDGVDVHSYFLRGELFKGFLSRTSFLKRFNRWMQKHYPDKNIKMSEWTHMQGGRDKTMKSGLVTANVIYEDLTLLNAVSWQHWIAVSEVDYCDGLIYINLEDRTFEMTKRYYVTGNFSKYIPCGAVRTEIKSDDPALKCLAFIKNEKTVIIIINDTPDKKTVSFPQCESENITLAVTDEEYNLKEFSLENGEIEITANSVNTIIF